jgi:hypothetical protein
MAANNLEQVLDRLCFDPRAIVSGIGRIFTTHWPELFGLERQPLTDFGIESALTQGIPRTAWLLLPALGIPLAHVVFVALRASHRPRTSSFPSFLAVTSLVSIAGYLAGRCGVVDFYTMRYELLSLLGAAGLAAWYLGHRVPVAIRAVWVGACALVFGISTVAHVRLLAEYATAPPTPAKQELIRALGVRGIRYAYADYWTSYYVTFMTREHIIVASTEVVKVRTYNNEVDAHRPEAILISRRPCHGGQQLTPAFWACKP